MPTEPIIASPLPTDPVELASKRRILPWLVAVALFMEALDATILNTAVPTIAESLSVGPLSMKAALTSYTLSLAVFIPISGWIADRFGTRLVFSSAIGVFSLGSLLCGMSVNMPMLVASRILQGCGGALMMPVGRITMVRTFPRSELLKAMSFVAIPGLIGPMIGPLAGGLIVAHFNWRMIFFVNLPIGLLGLIMVYRHMPNFQGSQRTPLDIRGMLLFGSGIALLSYVLEVFGDHSLSVQENLVLLAVSVVLLGSYVAHALRAKFPLLQLRLFGLRTFRTAIMGSLVTRLGIAGMPFLLPLLYQVGLGFTPIQSSLMIMPQPLAAMGLKILMPGILSRLGYRRVLLLNTAALGLMLLAFMMVGRGTPVWLIVIQAFLFGFLQSLQYTCINTLVYADLSDEAASMGSSISSTVQQMSMSFGVTAASLLTILFLGGDRDPGADRMIGGIHQAMMIMGLWTIFSSLVFWPLKPNDGEALSSHHEED